MAYLDTLRQRGHMLELRPDGKVHHRGPAGATDEIREHLDEIRAELLAEAATATADGNPATAPSPPKTASQIDEPRDLDGPDVPEHTPGRVACGAGRPKSGRTKPASSSPGSGRRPHRLPPSIRRAG